MERINILLIDDDTEVCEKTIKILDEKKINDFELRIEAISDFREGIKKISEKDYDILILDLCKGPPSPAAPKPGEKIMKEIKENCFLPVIFFTGLPAYVKKNETNLVRVVQKGSGAYKKLQEEIEKLLLLNFVHVKRRLNRVIQKSLKETFWDFVDKEWDKIEKAGESFSLGYLAIRRLLKSLSRENMAMIFNDPAINSAKIHPLEFYICPPINASLDMGDILCRKDGFYIVLNPSCDLCNKKHDYVVISKCQPLSENEKYKSYAKNRSKKNYNELGKFIRSGSGDRFYFLPKNEFIGLPDCYLDFEQIYNIKKENIGKYKKVAHLDSPFSADILTRFARFYNRTGSPDIDHDYVLEYIEEQLPKKEDEETK